MIDTAAKRSSALDHEEVWQAGIPLPDGAVSHGDRRHLLHSYGGVSFVVYLDASVEGANPDLIVRSMDTTATITSLNFSVNLRRGMETLGTVYSMDTSLVIEGMNPSANARGLDTAATVDGMDTSATVRSEG